MRNLIRFIIRFQNFFLFLLLEGIAFALIFNSNPYQRSTFLNSGNGLAGLLYEQSRLVGEYFQLRHYNEELAVENIALKNLLFHESDEPTDISYFTDSIPQRGFYFINARVVKNSINLRMNYLTIDKGTKDGITNEMAVVSPIGLVGLIKGCSNHYSVVTPLLNTQLFVSSKIGKSGYFGSLQWDGTDFRYAKLRAVEKHATIAIGDTVLTTGYGAIFPEGIKVGYISGFKSNTEDDFYDISVKLAVDFKSLYYVQVIGNRYASEIDSLKILEDVND